MADNNKWRCRAEDLKGTKTEENLRAAFAGESEAPEVCPVCNHAQAYFQLKPENF